MSNALCHSSSLGFSFFQSSIGRQGLSVFGSLSDDTVASSNSARCHRAGTGEKSGLHLLSGRLPKTDVCSSGVNMKSGDVKDDGARGGSFAHSSIMLEEIREVFSYLEDGVMLDATLGGAGHARALLSDHSHVQLLGIDQDDVALQHAAEFLQDFTSRVTLRRARFDAVEAICAQEKINQLSGALFDLGVSSPQFDVSERGFSYRHDGPLDMRMDRRSDLTADVVVNTYSESELTHLIHVNSDERFAQRIARAIVAARPIHSTVQLAEVITAAIPAATRRRGGHPAKRTFQAIRIEVNKELEILPEALHQVISLLAPGARLAVVTFHSGEDRIVKEIMRHAETGGCSCPPGLPCACGAQRLVRRVRAPRTPSQEEILRNNRAASARLRVVEKIEGQI